MGRTRGHISNEIYEIIYGKDIRVLHAVMLKHFPRARRSLDKLSLIELESLVPILAEAYKKTESKQKADLPLAGVMR